MTGKTLSHYKRECVKTNSLLEQVASVSGRKEELLEKIVVIWREAGRDPVSFGEADLPKDPTAAVQAIITAQSNAFAKLLEVVSRRAASNPKGIKLNWFRPEFVHVVDNASYPMTIGNDDWV